MKIQSNKATMSPSLHALMVDAEVFREAICKFLVKHPGSDAKQMAACLAESADYITMQLQILEVGGEVIARWSTGLQSWQWHKVTCEFACLSPDEFNGH